MERKAPVLTFIAVLLVLLLLVASVPSLNAASEAPVTEWDRTYGGVWGVAAFSTDDSGYAIAGTTGDWLTASRGGGSWTNETLMLIKTDADEVQWLRNYTRGMMRSAILTSDGGYALLGTMEANLVKLDSQGDVQWKAKYAAFADAFVWSMIQTIDDGFAIVGYGDHPLYGTESRLVKVDSNGNVQWNKTYGEPNESNIVRSIIETDDDGYILAGSTTYLSVGQQDMWLVKLDLEGNVLWEKRYGEQNGEDCSSVVRTIDGGYLLVGSTASFGAGDSDGWVVKCDSQGNMQWNKTYGETGRDSLRAAVQARNGGYVLVGRTDTIRSPTGVVVKLSASGEVEWEKSFSGDNTPESVTVASDGGYIFAGYKGEPTNRDNEVWVVKIAPDAGTQETETLYTILIVAAVVILAVVDLGLLICFRKQRSKAENSAA